MALSNGHSVEFFFEDLPFNGSVRCVAAPSWVRPCFAIPLVNLGPKSNALYVQEIDGRDRIVGLSPFDVPDEAMVTLAEPVIGLHRGEPSIHAVIGPEGECLAGQRADLAPIVAKWLSQIDWPVTRLAFADFVGDERQVMAAADAALKDKSNRHGQHRASVWFANSVVFRRLQRSALETASSPEHRAELEAALDQIRMDVTETDMVAQLPPLLMDLFDGANVRAAPALSMATKLAMLVSPRGLSFKPSQVPRKPVAIVPDPIDEIQPGGEFAELWQELNNDLLTHPIDESWPQRWTFAWTTSLGHPDFERLAYDWLQRAMASPLAVEASEMLFALIDQKYRRLINGATIDLALRWLDQCSPETPRWPKIWNRVAHFERMPGSLVKQAYSYLREARPTAFAQRDWIRVWTTLKLTEPELRGPLDDLALVVLEHCNRHVDYIRRVAIPLFSSGQQGKYVEELWYWFLHERDRGDAWAEFYLHALKTRPMDNLVRELGLAWLVTGNMSSRRWPRIWHDLYNVIGPNPKLMMLGARYLQQLRPSQRRNNFVWVIFELSDLLHTINTDQQLSLF